MRLTLDLANCYGINNLQVEFDFTKSATNNGVNSLYAPNGTLKTSLAKTFKDIEEGNDTKDQIFPHRVTKRDVKIDNVDVIAAQVMVIDSYNESYSSRQVSNLLVNDALKQQYETALREVDDKRNALLKGLAKLSGKREIVPLICEVFGIPEKALLETLAEYKQSQPDYTQFSEFKFGDLFNPKVTELLASEGFNQDLTEYVDTYDKLIQESAVLSKSFNHQKAGAVSKSLNETGFFTASHSVNMSIRGVKQEVTTREQLNQLLQDEQDKVLKSPELREKFSRVDAKLNTKDTQVFRDFIAEHQALLPEYQNLELFKKKVFIGYLQANQEFWDDLVATYTQNQELVANIIHQAQQQKTTWETVVNTFNKRFKVPFKLSIDNQDEVILNGAAPVIKFEFNDGRGDTQSVSKQNLLQALSQGEKRAFYILNLLFEIEVRQNVAQPVVIVIDDIADSFDYKNKYAIVEYLNDIAKTAHFSLLLLTHNFDFHRIVSSRLGAKRQNRHFALKSETDIKIKKEKYQKDVFNAWKQELATNEQYLLASIPFTRNIADYCGHEEYSRKLTSLLHVKSDTRDIRISDIQALYRAVFIDLNQLALPNGEERVIDVLFRQSDTLVADNHESPDLESKVILAIAIRLKAEIYMIAKISNPQFVDQISSNQTRELFDKFKELNPEDLDTLNLLDQVNLMTPENIHLNSFMYEPILDMSAHSLYQLYSDVNNLR